jgi:hypothetical protein
MSMRALKQVTAGRVKANHRKVDDPKKEKVSDYDDDRSDEERLAQRFHFAIMVAVDPDTSSFILPRSPVAK